MINYTDIENASPPERARMRAAAVRQLGKLEGQSVDRGPFRITVTDGPVVGENTVTLSLSVVRISTGKDVTPPDLNPIVIVNPPLLVPDPQGTIIRLDENGNSQGTYRFDPRAALFAQIRDLIR